MITVVGSTNTDMVVKTDRFAQPGETILGGDFFMFPGGKGANQAVAAARLGGEVTFVTMLGNDTLGDRSQAGLVKEGIDPSCIYRSKGQASGVALITVNEHGENQIIVAPGSNLELTSTYLPQQLISRSDIVLTQLETPMPTLTALAVMCRQSDTHLVLNPAPAQEIDPEIFDGLFLITPNQTEAELLTHQKVTSEQDASQAAQILLDQGVQHVIITMGALGSYYKSSDQEFFVKAEPVSAIDTTAAGDVFNGALVTALSKHSDWKKALRFASKAAAISVTRMGAQTSAPYLDEVV